MQQTRIRVSKLCTAYAQPCKLTAKPDHSISSRRNWRSMQWAIEERDERAGEQQKRASEMQRYMTGSTRI
jgi:hypothetical protein